MGNKFIERHKRKPLLALLLLLFRGRSKYIALLVIVILFSLPFVATSDMIERFFGLSPVKYMLKFLGRESVVASINPKYSNDIIKATFDRLKQETQVYSLWNKAGLGEEDRGERGTLAFVKVDDEIFKKKEGKSGKAGREVDIGYSNEEEGGNKEVDLNEIISGKAEYWGLSLNNENTFGSYGPFIAKDTFQGSKNNFGVDYKGKGSIGLNALDNIKGNIPDVSNLSLSKKGKVKVSKMGSLKAYGWKNVGYTKKRAVVDVNTSGSRRALFQMGETLATTSMAYKQNPAYEYQAAYTGATYDGNSLNLGIIQTAGDPNITLPNTGYVSDVIGSAIHWVEIAHKCQEAQAVHGTAISKLQDEIDNILKTMADPPKCCKHRAVNKWNNKVSQVIEKCNKINSHSVSLANECGNSTPQTVNCQSTYGKLYIKPCSKVKCWLGIILAIVGALIGFLIAGPVGAVIGAAIGFAVGTVASIYLQMAAMGAAFAGVGAYFADQKSQKAIEVVEDINKDVAKEK